MVWLKAYKLSSKPSLKPCVFVLCRSIHKHIDLKDLGSGRAWLGGPRAVTGAGGVKEVRVRKIHPVRSRRRTDYRRRQGNLTHPCRPNAIPVGAPSFEADTSPDPVHLHPLHRLPHLHTLEQRQGIGSDSTWVEGILQGGGTPTIGDPFPLSSGRLLSLMGACLTVSTSIKLYHKRIVCSPDQEGEVAHSDLVLSKWKHQGSD